MLLVKVMVIGTLADKPIIRHMESDRKLVGLSVYTVRLWCDAETGREQRKKEWHRVVITNQRLVSYAENHLAKDDDIYLEGELQTDFWRDATYELQSVTYITLCQEGDKLRRVADERDCEDPELALGMLAMAQNGRLAVVPTDDKLRACGP